MSHPGPHLDLLPPPPPALPSPPLSVPAQATCLELLEGCGLPPLVACMAREDMAGRALGEVLAMAVAVSGGAGRAGRAAGQGRGGEGMCCQAVANLGVAHSSSEWPQPVDLHGLRIHNG